MIHYLYPGGKKLALTFSYDDGVIQDRRLVPILNKNGLKGTFNINAEHMNATKKPADAHRERLTAEQAKALLRVAMEEAVAYAVPLSVEIQIGDTWFDAK